MYLSLQDNTTGHAIAEYGRRLVTDPFQVMREMARDITTADRRFVVDRECRCHMDVVALNDPVTLISAGEAPEVDHDDRMATSFLGIPIIVLEE